MAEVHWVVWYLLAWCAWTCLGILVNHFRCRGDDEEFLVRMIYWSLGRFW